MGKLRTGPSTSIIKASQGPKSSLDNFYATSYQASYGNDDFVPRFTKPAGTGYKANFRPEIYYTNRLDEVDNVRLGQDMKENYVTSFTTQQRPCYTGSDGRDEFPATIIPRKSGFTREDQITSADSKKVENTRLETMTGKVYKPLLQRLQNKRVPHLDDGSPVLTTETSTCYLGKPNVRLCTRMKDVGAMEPSGFTHYHHFEPIMYLDRAPFDGARDGCKTLRPTGISEHKGHFVSRPSLSGGERNPGVREQAKRDTGFTHEIARPRFTHRRTDDAYTNVRQVPYAVAARVKKQDPCEYLNMTIGGDTVSLASCNYKGWQRPAQTSEDLMARMHAGRKEPTGFSTNNVGHVETTGDRARFTSHYDTKFGPKSALYPPGRSRVSGFTKQTNGFTKSTVVHTFGDGVPFSPTSLRHLHPHAAKVMKREHPCYVDGTRNFKMREPAMA